MNKMYYSFVLLNEFIVVWGVFSCYADIDDIGLKN